MNLYAYCGNNPVGNSDPTGCSWEEFTAWVGDGLETWKEHSFVYNVLICNVTLYAGVGIGIGAEANIGVADVSLITKAEHGIAFTDGAIKAGEFGESSASVNLGPLYVGAESTVYRTDGQLPEEDQKVDFGLENDDLSVGASLACLISVTVEASISLRGVFEDFVAYGNKYWW